VVKVMKVLIETPHNDRPNEPLAEWTLANQTKEMMTSFVAKSCL